MARNYGIQFWTCFLVFPTLLNAIVSSDPVPPAPTNVKLKRISQTIIQVSWDRPATFSSISGYQVYYNIFAVPDMEQWQMMEIGPFTVTEVSGLEVHTIYAFRVRAKTSDSYGEFSDIVTSNQQAVLSDDTVHEFAARSNNPRDVMLEWSPPRRPGVARYKVVYEGYKQYRDGRGRWRTLTDQIKDKFSPGEERTMYIDWLVPDTTYTFNISAKFLDRHWGPQYEIKVRTAVDAPPAFAPPRFRSILSDTSIHLELQRASGKNGRITHYLLIAVIETLAEIMAPTDFQLYDEPLRSGSSKDAWIAARFEGDLPTAFRLGDGTDRGNGRYNNPPLNKDRTYRVFVRAFTRDSLFTDSPYSEPLSTDRPNTSHCGSMVPYLLLLFCSCLLSSLLS